MLELTALYAQPHSFNAHITSAAAAEYHLYVIMINAHLATRGRFHSSISQSSAQRDQCKETMNTEGTAYALNCMHADTGFQITTYYSTSRRSVRTAMLNVGVMRS